MQLNHYNTTFQKCKFPIILLCDHVHTASNIGGLFRTADAFGIEKLIFCGENISLGRKMIKSSRATEKVVSYSICESIEPIFKDLKTQGYQMIALEITHSSLPIHTYNFIGEQPVVLVVGDENLGVSEFVLKNSDVILHIDMYGHNSSMNVVQAATIALYEITKHYLLPND